MNRERNLGSYRDELGLDPLKLLPPGGRWLDLCCGRGRALAEAADLRPDADLTGVDLVSTFVSAPRVRFVESPLREYQPTHLFDLITCVHGLHYVGDKLGAIARACSWLTDRGLFVAQIDLANLRWSDRRAAGRTIVGWLRTQGLEYSRRRVLCRGRRDLRPPFPYAHADATAGPNYTGQPAVNSLYHRS